MGCGDGMLQIFGRRKLTPLATLALHGEGVGAVVFAPPTAALAADSGTDVFASGDKNGKIAVWAMPFGGGGGFCVLVGGMKEGGWGNWKG